MVVVAEENEIIEETAIENNADILVEDDTEQESRRFKLPEIKLPKWALILLMTIPSFLIAGTIILIDHFVGFPENINPVAIIGLIGMVLFGIAVLGDMAYRNFFIYRMVRRENLKSKIYKDIIKDKQKKKDLTTKHDYLDDEYQYEEDEEDDDDEEDIEFVEDISEADEIDEYEYELDDEDPEDKYYKMKSLIFRGGIFSILIVNGFLLLILAFILQATYGGGFSASAEEI